MMSVSAPFGKISFHWVALLVEMSLACFASVLMIPFFQTWKLNMSEEALLSWRASLNEIVSCVLPSFM